MGCTSTTISQYTSYKGQGNRTAFPYKAGHGAEGNQREWAAQLMQMYRDNGLNIGGDFDEWFNKIAVNDFHYAGEQVFADDGWAGKNSGDKDGNYMGPKEFQALCMVMADLEDMRTDGRMTNDEFEAKMTELFSKDSMHALMVGDKWPSGEENPFLNIACNVANMHGDDPNHADTRAKNGSVSIANRALTPVGRRAIINEPSDYAYSRMNEYNAENGTWRNVGENFQNDFNDVDNIISQWAANGMLPEGLTQQQAASRVTVLKGQLEANGLYGSANVTTMAFAFQDIDAIEDPDVKAAYVANLFDGTTLEDIVMGENMGDEITPGIQFLQALDLVRTNPEFVTEQFHKDTVHNYNPDNNNGSQPPSSQPGSSQPGSSQPANDNVQTPISEIGDMSTMLYQAPSGRVTQMKKAAIEYFNNGSQYDIAQGFADQEFTPEEIENIKLLAAFGPTYLESASGSDIYAITNPGRDLSADDSAFYQERFETAANIMTWDDPHAFIDACVGAGMDENMAALYYDSAARIFKGVAVDDTEYERRVEAMGADTNFLLDASSNAMDYMAEKTKDGEPAKAIAEKADVAKEEIKEGGTSLYLC